VEGVTRAEAVRLAGMERQAPHNAVVRNNTVFSESKIARKSASPDRCRPSLSVNV
jgi:hypothetical protein